jgi:HEAT repeat protein
MAFVKKPVTHTLDANHDERTIGRDFAGLVGELNSDNSSARRWAVRDLATQREAVSVLVERLDVENDSSVRTAILSALAHLGGSEAIAGVVNCLRSEDAALRNEAIEVLKEVPNEVEPIIDSLLVDVDSDVRIFTVNILESLKHKNVEKWLIRVVETDSHLNVCATALDLLSEVGTMQAVPAIKQLKARFADEPYICFSADFVLKRIAEGDQ